jgi:uncharacterized protein (DUF2225 family)
MKPFFWICPNDGSYHGERELHELLTCDICGTTFKISEVEEDTSTINAADLVHSVEAKQ